MFEGGFSLCATARYPQTAVERSGFAGAERLQPPLPWLEVGDSDPGVRAEVTWQSWASLQHFSALKKKKKKNGEEKLKPCHHKRQSPPFLSL